MKIYEVEEYLLQEKYRLRRDVETYIKSQISLVNVKSKFKSHFNCEVTEAVLTITIFDNLKVTIKNDCIEISHLQPPYFLEVNNREEAQQDILDRLYLTRKLVEVIFLKQDYLRTKIKEFETIKNLDIEDIKTNKDKR